LFLEEIHQVADGSLIEIEDLAELNSALDQSGKMPVLIFKHSITCGISARADRQMKKLLSSNPPENALYRLIIVQHSRAVSNTVAEELGVPHESPQVIIVRDGKPVWNASHDDITEDSVRRALVSGA
jgi:bacillithiol system protein YtxJ